MTILFRVFTAVVVCSFVQFHSPGTFFAYALVGIGSSTHGVTVEDFLHIFNEHRQDLIPPAADMMLLRWNAGLHEAADIVARQCTSTEEVVVSESGYMGLRLEVPPSGDIEQYIYEYFNNQSTSCNNGSCDIAYLNTIWHDLQEIGCAAAECESEIQGYLVVCLYPNIATVTDLDSAYTVGTPCTLCPGDFPACHNNYSLCTNQIPTEINIIQHPGPNVTKAGQRFTSNAMIQVVDRNGEPFTGKQNSACPYEIGVEFSMRSHHEARLRGDTVVNLVEGVATFEDLTITQPGEYKLRFYLESPENVTALEVTSDMLTIDYPPDTIDNCTVEEGDGQFERFYEWKTSNCSKVCIEDCKGQYSSCYEFEGCGPHADCEDGKCVCKNFRDIPRFQFNAESLRDMLRPQSICDPDRIAVRLDKCGLNILGYTLADLYLLGPKAITEPIDAYGDINDQLLSYIQSCAYNDCRGRVTVGTDAMEYELGVSGNFGDCNADISDNETHVTYTHRVRGFGGFSSSQITRKRSLAVDFSCTYVRSLTTSLDFGIDVLSGTEAVAVHDQGSYGVEISMWEDSTYTTKYTTPPVIMVPEFVFVGLTLEGLESTEVILYADHCYATPTPDEHDSSGEDLVTDGCSANDDVTVAQNGEGRDVYFSFKSFTFIGQTDNTAAYIHCDVVVCAVNDTTACTVSCSGRRRKRSISKKHDYTTVSLGPVNMRKTHDTQSISIQDEKYSSYFSKDFSTQELINPPVERTAGFANVNVYFA